MLSSTYFYRPQSDGDSSSTPVIDVLTRPWRELLYCWRVTRDRIPPPQLALREADSGTQTQKERLKTLATRTLPSLSMVVRVAQTPRIIPSPPMSTRTAENRYRIGQGGLKGDAAGVSRVELRRRCLPCCRVRGSVGR